jgi:hypothetical protein
MILRKIPLGPFIEILQGLYEEGADFIDLSGEENNEGEAPKDSIKITVKPEYLSDDDGHIDIEIEQIDEEEENDILDKPIKKRDNPLSDDDINELM